MGYHTLLTGGRAGKVNIVENTMQQNVLELKIYRNSCHQWVYKKMVDIPRKGFNRAMITKVKDKAGVFAGVGIFNPNSTVAIRFLTANDENIDRSFFHKRLASLKNLKENILGLAAGSDCYRLVHSESDGLPGLIIDKFNDYIMIKPYCAGYGGETMDFIASSLAELYPGAKIMVSPDEKSCAKDGADYRPEIKKYPSGRARAEISEFGVKFAVDFEFGQKTGFFLDQKLNRRLAASMCRGMDVLDLCCYTGGFGISMKKAGAKSVTCVDTDPDAIATARKNAKINGCEVEFLNINVFEYLRDALAKGKNYDFIICDPAKLAANKLELPRAYRTYGDLNKLAIQCVKGDGLLFTFSCTGLVSDKIFQSIVFNSAREAGASLKVLAGVGPSPDHPYSSTFPEGKYLKGLLAQVEKNNYIFPERLVEIDKAKT